MNVIQKLKAITEPKPPSEPKTMWDQVIASTPVVMTVVATILAALSSSEMTTAQYHRSMAAQFQSKAGDQWSFYQAKRLRESGNQTSLDLLETLTGPGRLDALTFASQFHDIQHRLDNLTSTISALVQSNSVPDIGALKDLLEQSDKQASMLASQWNEALADPQVTVAVKYLAGDDLPTIQEQRHDVPAITTVLAAIDAGKNEVDTVDLVRQVKRADLDEAEVTANANANAFDAATKPIVGAIDRVGLMVSSETGMLRRLQRDAVDQLSAAAAEGGDVVRLLREVSYLRQAGDELMGSFSAARLRFDARRYQQESAYNFVVARLYEVEVRRSSGLSDRNRDRSKNFFYGMLVAQAAVTIATFSLALRQQSVLWALASAAGVLAIGLGIYVYLFT
jgi:hypothetical protein